MVEPKVIFLHIPKTGGQSLRKIAEGNYAKGESFPVYPNNPSYANIEDLVSLEGASAERLRLIAGHVSYGLHERLPYGCVYFSMMRDPVDRVLSAYHHILRTNERAAGQSLPRIFESKRKLLDNHQTRILSGHDPDFGGCTADMLWEAVENIERDVAFVGIMERFAESTARLGEIFGWRTTSGEKINVNPQRRDAGKFAASEIGLIEDHNRYDIMLYRWVVRRYFEDSSRATASAAEAARA